MKKDSMFDDSGQTGDHDLEEAAFLNKLYAKHLYSEYKSVYSKAMRRKNMTSDKASAVAVCAIIERSNVNILRYLQRKGIIQLPD